MVTDEPKDPVLPLSRANNPFSFAAGTRVVVIGPPVSVDTFGRSTEGDPTNRHPGQAEGVLCLLCFCRLLELWLTESLLYFLVLV